MVTRPSVTQVASLGDFSTLINWDVAILTPPSGVSSALFTNGQLNFRCESSDIPRYQQQSSTIMVRGFPVKQPGIQVPTQSIQLSLYETVDNMVTQFITDWRTGGYNPVTGVQIPKTELVAIVQLTRNDRQSNPIWQYTLYNCYLEDYDPTGGPLGSQSADLIKPSITLSYDYFSEQSVTGNSTT